MHKLVHGKFYEPFTFFDDEIMFERTVETINDLDMGQAIVLLGAAHCISWQYRLQLCPIETEVIFIAPFSSSERNYFNLPDFLKPQPQLQSHLCSLDHDFDECDGMLAGLMSQADVGQ